MKIVNWITEVVCGVLLGLVVLFAFMFGSILISTFTVGIVLIFIVGMLDEGLSSLFPSTKEKGTRGGREGSGSDGDFDIS